MSLKLIEPLLERLGVRELYPTQREVVNRDLVDSGNFVLAAPTASGKTLVAEMIMYRELIRGGKVIYLSPLRALASEKFEEFNAIFDYPVRLSIGDYDSSEEPLSKYKVIVMTYEKFDSLIRHSPRWLDEVSLLVMDEIHYVGDPHRGPAIEMSLSTFMTDYPYSRRVALSATISNLEEISEWLGAIPIKVNWRPVPLRVGVYVPGRILYKDGSFEDIGPGDPVLSITQRSISAGGQVLIFYNRRSDTISAANKLSQKLKIQVDDVRTFELSERIKSTDPGSKLVSRLADLVKKGVAFHHAGLSHSSRKLIEQGFREGLIKVITATPTLAAGVNLPARTVIIRSYLRYDRQLGRMSPISVMEFWQMAGRAGRPKYDKFGEAFLISKSPEEADELLSRYVNSNPEPVRSSLYEFGNLVSHLLALISVKGPVTIQGIMDVFNRTLLSVQGGVERIRDVIPKALADLEKDGFVKHINDFYEATRVGKRVSELYIDPRTAKLMITALGKMKGQYVDERSILLFISSLQEMPRVSLSRSRIDFLEEEADSTELLVSLHELPIVTLRELLQAMKATISLEMWIEEEAEGNIEEKVGIEPGDLRVVVDTATWLIYSFSEIARVLNHWEEAKALRKLARRVKYGVKEELIELVQMEGIGRRRARVLFEAGYQTIKDLCNADPMSLASLPLIGVKLAESIVKEARSICNAGSSN